MFHFSFDVSKYEFFCGLKIPNVRLEGDYTVSGRVLIAPIEGKGKFTAEIGKDTSVSVTRCLFLNYSFFI